MLDAEGVEMEGEERREEGGFYGVESFPDPNSGDRSPPPPMLRYPVSQIMFPSVCETKDKVDASLTKAPGLANLAAINSLLYPLLPLRSLPPTSGIQLHLALHGMGGVQW